MPPGNRARGRARADAVLLLVVGAIGGVLLGTLLADRRGRRPAQRHPSPRRPHPRANSEVAEAPPPPPATPAPEADERLEEQVLDAFRRDPVLARRAIDISARMGEVTLTGWVRSTAERRAAVALTRAIPGVREVRSEVVVMPITFRG